MSDNREASEAELMLLREAVWAVIFLAIGVIAIAASLRLERPAGWATAPGLLPIVAGAFVVIFSTIELGTRLVSLQPSRIRAVGNEMFSWARLRERRAKQAGTVFGVLFIYYFVLIRVLPFELATFVFLAMNIRLSWKTSAWKLVLIVGGLTALIVGVFRLTGLGYYLP